MTTAADRFSPFHRPPAQPREVTNRRAFLQTPPTIGGIRMRPVTGGTLELCRLLGLGFVDNFLALESLPESEAQRQIFTFLFIHGHPDIAQMLEVIWLPPEELSRAWLIPFAIAIPIETVVPAVWLWLVDVNTMTQAAMVDIAPKPPIPGAKPDAAPPNS